MSKRNIFVAAAATALAAAPANAYDFGFVRAPDWMNPYVGALVALALIMMLASFLTKPMDVPFNQLYRTPLNGAAAVCFRSLQLTFAILMVAVFYGMYLARA